MMLQSIRAKPTIGVSLVSLTFLCVGCATSTQVTAKRLPKPEEFKKTVPQILTEYPDLTHFSDWRWKFQGWKYASDPSVLIAAWGEPTNKKGSAWLLWDPVANPATIWSWYLHGKKISARVDHPITTGYRPLVAGLDVTESKRITGILLPNDLLFCDDLPVLRWSVFDAPASRLKKSCRGVKSNFLL
jgi:hypothetical protein